MNLRESFIDWWVEEHGTPPAGRWVICDCCQGDGTSTAYLGAYTQSDRDEMGDEWFEFAEDVRAGHYDRPCDECSGTGKVREFAGLASTEFQEWQREAAQDAATMRAESGGW